MLWILEKKAFIPIILSSFLLTAFGLSTLLKLGSDNSIFYKQLIIVIISISACIFISHINLRFLKEGNTIFYGYIFIILLLTIILGLGATINNAQSWFRIGGVAFQPSEFAKLAIIAMLAKYFYRRHLEIANIKHIIMSFLYVTVAGFLVLNQPDLGSALVIFGIWSMVLFASGISKKHILLIISIATFLFYIAWHFVLVPYQKNRILNFVDPLRDVRGSGYNVYQSVIAIGSGGLYGKGVSQGTQSTLRYLPESDTDFAFAAFAEEWGFVGAVMCILAFLILILSLLSLAFQADTNFETLFIVGIAAYFLIHFIVNIGMNLGAMPVTGIPLPFMSAGGTHTLLEWAMLGIVFSMQKNSARSQKVVINKELFS